MAVRSESDVLAAEQHAIRAARDRAWSSASGAGDGHPSRGPRPADEGDWVGLAFSGGGIRSATFNLGVLQALAKLGLLHRFDYLSTVSGGGYVGGWLTALTARLGSDVNGTASQLAQGAASGREKPGAHPVRASVEHSAINWLRQYSNYLTPRLGLFSLDTWAFVGSYLRNLTLNFLLLTASFLLVLLVPRIWNAVASMRRVTDVVNRWTEPFVSEVSLGPLSVSIPGPLLLLAGVCALVALGATLTSLRKITANANGDDSPPVTRSLSEFPAPPTPAASSDDGTLQRASGGKAVSQALTCVILPVLLAAAAVCLWARQQVGSLGWTRIALGGAVSYALVWAAGLLLAKLWTPTRLQKVFGVRTVVMIMAFAAVAGVVGGVLIKALVSNELMHPFWGVPLIVAVLLGIETLHIGLVCRDFEENVREWWGRSGGLLTQVTLLLSALVFTSVTVPPLIEHLLPLVTAGAQSDSTAPWWRPWVGGAVSALWALVSGSGIWAAQSGQTGAPAASGRLDKVALFGGVTFIVGYILLLSVLSHRWMGHELGTLGIWWGALLIVTALFSWRFDINVFSMNALYQNRLVRCYLGASRGESRQAEPFTGFDAEDDIPLADCAEVRPYPLVNGAINLVSARQLAWQQRKAAAFLLSPLYCGYQLVLDKSTAGGYAPTAECGLKRGPTLGLGVSISGAAASPNMGYHSSPVLSFLLTLFNVRLGAWFPNTALNGEQQSTGTTTTPSSATSRGGSTLAYLLRELLGRTDETTGLVYLSDGGHFENLGLYELVRRRCRFIVVSDAGQDGQMSFGDLGNAIEKCRTDFGAEIDIDPQCLRVDSAAGRSPRHVVVGRIRYAATATGQAGVAGNRDGTLVYFKPTLTGDEPADVLRYAAENREFPHQTTADQWFSESQFESYRMLGEHITTAVFKTISGREALARCGMHELFGQLEEAWYAPSEALARSFTKHTATLQRLWQSLRANRDLAFLDQQIYPAWLQLMEGSTPDGSSGDPLPPAASERRPLTLPASEAARRAGFYYCCELLQLMEDVYVDCNLEETFAHPDNRGWMNLFRHWAWSSMVMATWSITAPTYGARFQRFCERHLNLTMGGVEMSFVDVHLADTAQHTMSSWKLNLLEQELVTRYLALGRKRGLPDRLKLWRFDVVKLGSDALGDAQPLTLLRFSCGFALTDEHAQVLYYLRVQNHLRNVGLGRRALQLLLTENPNLTLPPDDQQILGPGGGHTIDESAPTVANVDIVRRLLQVAKEASRSNRPHLSRSAS